VSSGVELTRATIEKCPPTIPPEELRFLLAVDGVRSVDLHRYRARLNLSPGCDAKAAWGEVARAIVYMRQPYYATRRASSAGVVEALKLAGVLSPRMTVGGDDCRRRPGEAR
jgi:hypothetical protein